MSKFIVFDGIECSGKSTQIEMVKEYLESKGVDVVLTREPGGTPLAESIRGTLLSPTVEEFHPNAEMLLAYAAREQHLKNKIKPALDEGKVVLCDRFSSSTYIIQVLAHGGDESLFHDLESHIVKKHREPDAYMIFDIDPEISAERLRIRNEAPDRIEMGGIEFLRQCDFGYKKFSALKNEERPGSVRVIDAAKDVSSVFEQVKATVDQILGSNLGSRPAKKSSFPEMCP